MNYQMDQKTSEFTLNLFDNSSMFYICLFNVRLPKDYLKEIEKCRSINTCEFDLKCILLLI